MKRKEVVKTIKSLKGEAGHKKVVDLYNAQKPLPQGYKLKSTDAWCAATVSVVFLQNGYNAFSECSCPRMVEKAKKAGLWEENDAYKPQPGDVVMYDWQDSGKGDDTGVPDHVGVVIAVGDKTFTVREGNMKGSIGNRTLDLNGRYIRGFIKPKFTEGSTSQKPKETTTSSPKEEKPSQGATAKPQGYKIGGVYTIHVNSALNVRTGAGVQYPKVPYSQLTADGKKHATAGGALLPGTRVTCLEVKTANEEPWIRIPSGWICAKYIK